MASNLHAYDLWSAIMRSGGASDAEIGNYWQAQAPTVLEAATNPALDTMDGWGTSGLLDPWAGGVYGTQFSPVFYEIAQQLGMTPNEASRYFSNFMVSTPQADAFDAVTQQAKATEALLRERGIADTPQGQQLIQNLYGAGDEWKSAAKKAERADVMAGAMKFASLVSGAVGGLSALGGAGFLGPGFAGNPFAAITGGITDFLGMGAPDLSGLVSPEIANFGVSNGVNAANLADLSLIGGYAPTDFSNIFSGLNVGGEGLNLGGNFYGADTGLNLGQASSTNSLGFKLTEDAWNLFNSGVPFDPSALADFSPEWANRIAYTGAQGAGYDTPLTNLRQGYYGSEMPALADGSFTRYDTWKDGAGMDNLSPADQNPLDWVEGGKGLLEILDAVGSIFQGGESPGPELPQPLTEAGEDPLNMGLFNRNRNQQAGGILGGFDSFNIGAPGLFVPR